MIIDFLLRVIYTAVVLIFSPILSLADVTLNPGVTSALVQVKSYLAVIDSFFPVSTLIVVLGNILLVDAGIVLYRVIMWIIKRFPTQS